MMTSHTRLRPACEEARLRAEHLVRQRWIKPASPGRQPRRAASEVDRLAEAALDAMLVRPFRISRLPAADERGELLAKVRYWVQRSKPIRILLGYAPMKNLNTCARSRADWAEFFAMFEASAVAKMTTSLRPSSTGSGRSSAEEARRSGCAHARLSALKRCRARICSRCLARHSTTLTVIPVSTAAVMAKPASRSRCRVTW